MIHFALQNTALNFVEKFVCRKVLGRSQSRQAKRKGVVGGSTFPLWNQIVNSPAICLNTWKTEHRQLVNIEVDQKRVSLIFNLIDFIQFVIIFMKGKG